MAQKDWITCKIPAEMAKSIDKFLKIPQAKKNRIFSRTDFLSRVSAIWLAKYDKDYKLLDASTPAADKYSF